MATLQSRLSCDLTTTREETIERISGWANAREWKVEWRDDRFMISQPSGGGGRTLFRELLAGTVVARAEGSRLNAGLGSLAPQYAQIGVVCGGLLGVWAILAEPRFGLLAAVTVPVRLVPLFFFRQKQRNALELLTEALAADIRVSASVGPYR